LAALPVNFAGLGLIVLGIALLVAEAFTPSLGALGIGGVVSFALGAAILVDTDSPEFAIAWPVIAGIAMSGLVLTIAVGRLALTARRRPVVTGREQMLGGRGKVLEWHGTSGHVFVHGERWKAESRATVVPGQSIRVAAVNGLTLVVEPESAEEGRNDDRRLPP
jgi:membrane-bound serine protease (ClpP class)